MGSLRALYVYAAFVAAVIDVVSVFIVYSASRERRSAWAYIAIAASMTGWCIGIGLQSLPEFRMSHPQLVDACPIGLMLLPAAALHAACVWSGSASVASKWRIVGLAYATSILLSIAYMMGFVYGAPVDHDWGAFREPGTLFVLHPLLAVGCVVTGAAWCFTAWKRSDDPRVKLRAKSWIVGVSSFLPLGMMNYLATFGIPVPPTGPVGNIVLVTIWGSAALRHNLLDVDSIILRTTAGIAISAAVAGPVSLALVWWQNIPLGPGSALVLLPFCLSAVAGIAVSSRLRRFLERSLEGTLFPARTVARESIRNLSIDMLRLNNSHEITSTVVETLRNGLSLSGAAVYWQGPEGDYYDLQRANNEAYPQQVSLEGAQRLADTETGPWDAIIPVGPEGQPVGFIAVGPKLSGAAIDDSDHALLSIIAGQLATAWRNIEHVREIQQQRDEIQNLQKRAEAENIVLRAEVRSATQFTEIIGASPALRSVLQFVEQVGPSDATVLITGETGTGKELVARALHDVSPRGYRPMICVNCPAIPADLAESELFGHERGAFTGAVETRPGKFEMSDNGTLFLDEIGDLPMSIQVKLLRALQEREIQRIGSHKTLKLNLRVIAATNRDLREAVAEGTFREDLFFRLCAVQIHVPSLRERLEDVPVLAAYFLQRAADRYQKEIFGFTADAVASLERYDWPGNIRELQHVVERAALLCSSDRIRPEQLGDLAAVGARPRSTLNASLQAEKRRRVETALEQAGGNQAAAARALGMSRSNFGRLMKSLGMKRPRD